MTRGSDLDALSLRLYAHSHQSLSRVTDDKTNGIILQKKEFAFPLL